VWIDLEVWISVFGRCCQAQPVDTFLHHIQGPDPTRFLIFGWMWVPDGPFCTRLTSGNATGNFFKRVSHTSLGSTDAIILLVSGLWGGVFISTKFEEENRLP
jgi:hypothetical protein